MSDVWGNPPGRDGVRVLVPDGWRTLETGMESGVLMSSGWGTLQMGMNLGSVPDGWGALQTRMGSGVLCLMDGGLS